MNIPDVLLIDDSEADRILTTEALKESGLINTISAVKDGEEGLKYLQKEGVYQKVLTPNLVLLDVNLPKMDGFDVLREIRSCENMENLPVILFSTVIPQEEMLSTLKDDFCCYLTKPVHADDFKRLRNSIEEFWESVNSNPVLQKR